MTAARLLLLLAMAVSAGVVAYGLLLARTVQAIPFTVAGLLVMGVSAAAMGIVLAIGAIGSGREGRAVRALAGASLGGLFMMAASAALAGAVIFALIVSPE